VPRLSPRVSAVPDRGRPARFSPAQHGSGGSPPQRGGSGPNKTGRPPWHDRRRRNPRYQRAAFPRCRCNCLPGRSRLDANYIWLALARHSATESSVHAERMPDLGCDTLGLATLRTAASVGQDHSLTLLPRSQARELFRASMCFCSGQHVLLADTETPPPAGGSTCTYSIDSQQHCVDFSCAQAVQSGHCWPLPTGPAAAGG
jgi:hypothetical protein